MFGVLFSFWLKEFAEEDPEISPISLAQVVWCCGAQIWCCGARIWCCRARSGAADQGKMSASSVAIQPAEPQCKYPSIRIMEQELQMKIERLEQESGSNDTMRPGHVRDGYRVCALCRGPDANNGMTCHRAPGTYRLPATLIEVKNGITGEELCVIIPKSTDRLPISVSKLKQRILKVRDDLIKQNFRMFQKTTALALNDEVYADENIRGQSTANISLIYQEKESLVYNKERNLPPELMEIKVCNACMPDLNRLTYYQSAVLRAEDDDLFGSEPESEFCRNWVMG